MRNQSFAPTPFRAESISPRLRWDSRYNQMGPAATTEIRPLLSHWLPELPRQGTALDIAAGAGRHSLALAARGLTVHAVDISVQGLQLLRRRMTDSMTIFPIVLDLERGWLPQTHYQVIVNFLFLERAVFPTLRNRLMPGGWLVMETFTVEQLQLPHKQHLRRNFLLEKGELYKTFAGMEILFYDEGLHDGNYTAQLVARSGGNRI